MLLSEKQSRTAGQARERTLPHYFHVDILSYFCGYDKGKTSLFVKIQLKKRNWKKTGEYRVDFCAKKRHTNRVPGEMKDPAAAICRRALSEMIRFSPAAAPAGALYTRSSSASTCARSGMTRRAPFFVVTR